MRKITYLLMVLAVAFIAVSCEKEPLQQFNESRSQEEVVPEAEDAVLVDSSNMNIDEVVDHLVGIINSKRNA